MLASEPTPARAAQTSAKRAARRHIAELAAVLIPTALAAGLILYHLGTRQLWIDEADTFATASQHGRLLWHWSLNDGGNMVAYYLGMHFYTEVAGTSEVALRLPSAVAGIATVPVGFLLLRRLFDLRAAMFGAFFLASSLPLAWWAQTARGYEPAALFVTASCLLLVLSVETRHKAAYAGYVVVSLLAIYTILLAALVIAAQAATLLFRRRRELPWRALLTGGAAVVVLSVPALAAAVIRGTAPIAWVQSPGSLFGIGNRYLVGVMASARISAVPLNGIAHLLTIVMAAAWALGVAFFIRTVLRDGRSKEAWGYLVLISWLVVPVVVSYLISVTVHPVLTDRYILGVIPAASMLAGVACSRLRPWPVAIAAGVVLVVMRTWVVVPGLGTFLENWRAAVAVVERHAKPHDCIAFFVSDNFDAFDYYALQLPPGHPALPVPVLPATDYQSRLPYVLDPATIAPAQFTQTVASCPRLWLVLAHQGPKGRPRPGAPQYQQAQYRNRVELLAEIEAHYRQTQFFELIGTTLRLYVRQ